MMRKNLKRLAMLAHVNSAAYICHLKCTCVYGVQRSMCDFNVCFYWIHSPCTQWLPSGIGVAAVRVGVCMSNAHPVLHVLQQHSALTPTAISIIASEAAPSEAEQWLH